MEIIFQLYESYEIKFPTKIASFTVSRLYGLWNNTVRGNLSVLVCV